MIKGKIKGKHKVNDKLTWFTDNILTWIIVPLCMVCVGFFEEGIQIPLPEGIGLTEEKTNYYEVSFFTLKITVHWKLQ